MFEEHSLSFFFSLFNDNGRIHQFTYDASGERVIKSSGDSQNVAINGETAATIVHTDDYTGYVSPYFVISKGKFTKHYFEGAGRIVSKLGNGSFAQPLKLTAGGVNYSKLTAEQQKALDNYVKFRCSTGTTNTTRHLCDTGIYRRSLSERSIKTC